DDLEDTSFDLIISLSPEAQHKAVEMTRTMACDVEFWPTMDPSVIEGGREERLEAYREVRDRLMDRIRERFPPNAAPPFWPAGRARGFPPFCGSGPAADRAC